MTLPPSLDLIAEPNPFAALMDLPSCMEAHERLAGLPQQAYRPLDRAMPAKDSGDTSNKAGPRDFGFIVMEVGGSDEKSAHSTVHHTVEITSITESELFG